MTTATTTARLARGVLSATLAACLTACAGLPPRLPPPPALAQSAPVQGLPSAADAAWPGDRWWQGFADPQLDGLITQALARSPSLAAARARVRGAEALAGLAHAATLPQAGVRADATRQRLSENGLIPPRFLGFTWYTQTDLAAQIDYSFDFWGKQQAELATRIDQARAAQAEAQAVHLGLTSAIVSAYFAWQTDQAQLHDAEALVRLQARLHALSAARVRRGLDPEDAATRARLQLSQSEAQSVALAGAGRSQHAVLAALVGVAPADLHLVPRPLPAPIAALPADARIELLARRPDLAALRWQVEAQGQQVRAARADFLPNLSLSAMAGFSSIRGSKTLAAGSRVFGVGPALSLPIFDGGLLKARYGVSVARLDAAVAQYNQAVLEAAREVGVAVLDLQRLQQQRVLQLRALDASEQLQRRAQARLRQGLTDAAPAIASQAVVLAQRASLIALHGQQLGAQVALIQALGGGFQAAPAGYAPRHALPSQLAPETKP